MVDLRSGAERKVEGIADPTRVIWAPHGGAMLVFAGHGPRRLNLVADLRRPPRLIARECLAAQFTRRGGVVVASGGTPAYAYSSVHPGAVRPLSGASVDRLLGPSWRHAVEAYGAVTRTSDTAPTESFALSPSGRLAFTYAGEEEGRQLPTPEDAPLPAMVVRGKVHYALVRDAKVMRLTFDDTVRPLGWSRDEGRLFADAPSGLVSIDTRTGFVKTLAPPSGRPSPAKVGVLVSIGESCR